MKTKEELELELLQVQINKTAAENSDLRRPRWQQAGYLAIFFSALAGLTSYVVAERTGFLANREVLLETSRAKVAMEIEKLEAQRVSIDTTIQALQRQEHVLRKDLEHKTLEIENATAEIRGLSSELESLRSNHLALGADYAIESMGMAGTWVEHGQRLQDMVRRDATGAVHLYVRDKATRLEDVALKGLVLFALYNGASDAEARSELLSMARNPANLATARFYSEVLRPVGTNWIGGEIPRRRRPNWPASDWPEIWRAVSDALVQASPDQAAHGYWMSVFDVALEENGDGAVVDFKRSSPESYWLCVSKCRDEVAKAADAAWSDRFVNDLRLATDALILLDPAILICLASDKLADDNPDPPSIRWTRDL